MGLFTEKSTKEYLEKEEIMNLQKNNFSSNSFDGSHIIFGWKDLRNVDTYQNIDTLIQDGKPNLIWGLFFNYLENDGTNFKSNYNSVDLSKLKKFMNQNKKYKNKIYETFKEKMGKVLLKFDSDLFTSYEAFESNLISIIS